ncbi:hypothetical protein CBG25_01120 [Arsenophonus sp. ENCA]|uniref:DUF805 domain-containing protein n=1 Tax=Arsenophonus sp. ENCA TaxID=1987579 RepID=UPI000BCAC0D0|nr:DUF805 domain-containing protein [Arsenophonus sp. ENCA]PAV10857.1 hypothetical protein CBG25_01120 [Arsenophonus sp. ENCA]
MTLQQWALSFKGRIGRKPFWLGMVIWFLLMVMIFSLQTFLLFSPYILLLLVILLFYPLAAIFTKRLHDRGKSGGWLLLLLLAFVLFSIDVSLFTPFWQWGIGRFLPLFIVTILFLDCGSFKGQDKANRYVKKTEQVDYFS